MAERVDPGLKRSVASMAERSDRRLLQVAEADGIIVFHVPCAVLPGEVEELRWEIADACGEVEQAMQRRAAVVVRGSQGGFVRSPPCSPDDVDRGAEQWRALVAAIAALTLPTVACLEGDALGPAWDLALACDLRIADRGIRVGSPEARLGRIPIAGATQRLPRLVGEGVALRLLLLAEELSASEALDAGLLHRVADSVHLEDALSELLGSLRSGAPVALAYAREAVTQGRDLALEGGLRLEADLSALLMTTSDRAEGIAAFLERRSADFEGR